MSKFTRPLLASAQNTAPVEAFVAELQQAIDTGDARLFNQSFAQDVLWGSPFGAVVSGYDQIHAIHTRMFARLAPVAGTWRYSVENVGFPTPDVVIAYIRRQMVQQQEDQEIALGKRFDELALIVLVRRNESWWLAAAQHVPDRRDVYQNSEILTPTQVKA